MISVIILTKNEQQDLPFCLDSLSWCSDIHVLDSGSTDRTQEIALSYGGTLSINEFRVHSTRGVLFCLASLVRSWGAASTSIPV